MAMAILVVGVVGMLQAVTLGSESLDTTRKQHLALQIAQSEIERLRDGAWTTIANLPATATVTIGSGGALSGDTPSFALGNYTAMTADDNVALSSRAAGFTCKLSTTRLRPGGATAATVTFMKVIYTIEWTSNTGRRHSRQFETYLGMNGLHLSYQQS